MKTLKCPATIDTMNECQRLRRLTAGCVMAITLGLVTAPLAGAQQAIDQVVQNMSNQPPESPFIRYLWQNGFGHLDIQRVWDDGNIVCVNRKAGVPPDQIIPLLQSRGYTADEAQALVAAERSAIGDRLSGPVC